MKQLIQVGVLAAALVFTLVGSYLVYFDESEGPSTDPDGVPVYVATADQLQKLTWQTSDKTLVIERKDDGDTWLQVTVTTREERLPEVEVADDDDGDDDTDSVDTDAADDTDSVDTDAADDSDSDESEPVSEPIPEIVETTTTFLGNDQADKLWEDFAPFRADRELSETGDADLGFDEPYATLTVQRTTGPVEVVIGGTTYGDRARYVRSGDKVFLLKKRAITRIEATDRLMERSLHPLARSDVDRIELSADGSTRTLVHQNPDDRAQAYWADAASPDTRDAAASAWAPDLIGLRARDYLDALPDGAEAVLTATLTGEGETYEVELFTDGDDGDGADAEDSDGDEPGFYARTTWNRGVVSVTPSQVETLLEDLDAVMNPTTENE